MSLMTAKDLDYWLEHVRIYANNGEVADYIPALANQQPEINAAAFYALKESAIQQDNLNIHLRYKVYRKCYR
nr:hypothetical protein [Alkalibacillus haloalkaliphilus]